MQSRQMPLGRVRGREKHEDAPDAPRSDIRYQQQSKFQRSRSVPIIRFQLRQHPVRVESAMNETSKAWNGELVRGWLESRLQAARLDQAAADRRGYEAQDDYDKAAAEEWVCRILNNAGRTDDQAAFAGQIKELAAQDEYRVTGIHDDRRFDRYVRANLRKVAKMTKANDGFANLLHHQG